MNKHSEFNSSIARKTLDYISTRLESMLRRPAVWGTNESVEDQVLQLLEIRRLLVDASCSDITVRQDLMRRYVDFISTITIPYPQSLSVRLRHCGRESEFCTILKQFVNLELTTHSEVTKT